MSFLADYINWVIKITPTSLTSNLITSLKWFLVDQYSPIVELQFPNQYIPQLEEEETWHVLLSWIGQRQLPLLYHHLSYEVSLQIFKLGVVISL